MRLRSSAVGDLPGGVSPRQPRNVAGFRGTVRYASVNAHKNRVSGEAWMKDWMGTVGEVRVGHTADLAGSSLQPPLCSPQQSLCGDKAQRHFEYDIPNA